MGENMISIPMEEYKKLIESSVRVEIFADFVNSTNYGVGRDECASYLGFKIKEE